MTKRTLLTIFLIPAFWLTLTVTVSAASLSFSPSSATVPNQCDSRIDIVVNTSGSSSNAADVFITYNPALLDIVDALPGVTGTQVEAGTAYEALFYNDVNTVTGEIKLTAGSANSALNGTGTIATIIFKNKAGVPNASFTYTFAGSGVTTDSNIADYTTSADILSSVTNGSVSFSGSYCAPTSDTTKPVISLTTPLDAATEVDPNTTVVFSITDSVGSINLSSLAFIVGGDLYQINSPEVSYTGGGGSYTITITKGSPYSYGTAIAVAATAGDTTGNVSTSQFEFTTSGDPSLSGDTSAPQISFVSPIADATGISANEPIVFTITEGETGLNLATSYIYLNGVQIYLDDAIQVTSTTSGDDITFTITTVGQIEIESTNSLIVYVEDMAGNNTAGSILFNQPAPSGTSIPVGGSIQDTITNIYQQIINVKSDELLDNTFLDGTVVDEIVTEIGITGTGAAASMLLLSLNLLPIFSLMNAPALLFNLLGIYLGIKRSRPWGLIIDKATNKPVEFATCRLYMADSKTLIEQSVSDQEGRYGFAIKPGEYRLEISKDGYAKDTRPLQILAEQRSDFSDIYLIPNTLYAASGKDKQLIPKGSFIRLFKRLTPIIFVLGLLLSIVSIISFPSTLNYIIGIIYTIVLLLVLVSKLKNKSKYSSVVDTGSNLKIPNAIVKIFDIESKELIDTMVTNNYGQYDYWGKPGRYGITVQVSGYSFPSKKYAKEMLVSLNAEQLLLVDLEQGKNKTQLLVDPLAAGSETVSSPYGDISIT